MSRYDAYPNDYLPLSPPFLGWYPGAFWGGAPMYGWGAWGWPAWPDTPGGYDGRQFGPRRGYDRGEFRAARGGDPHRRPSRYDYDRGYAGPRRPAPRYGREYRGGW